MTCNIANTIAANIHNITINYNFINLLFLASTLLNVKSGSSYVNYDLLDGIITTGNECDFFVITSYSSDGVIKKLAAAFYDIALL